MTTTSQETVRIRTQQCPRRELSLGVGFTFSPCHLTTSPKRLKKLWTVLPNPYITFLSRFKAGRKPETHNFQVQSHGYSLAPAGIPYEDDTAMILGEIQVLGTWGKGEFCYQRSKTPKDPVTCVSWLSPTLAKAMDNYIQGNGTPSQWHTLAKSRILLYNA